MDFPTFCMRSMKSVSSNERRVVDVRTPSSFYPGVQAGSGADCGTAGAVGGGSRAAADGAWNLKKATAFFAKESR